jgi:hypothetical protein
MEFGIGMEIDNEASTSATAVQAFVDHLAEFIRSRNYGAGIEHFTIGLVVIRSRPGYESLFKQRNPRFQKTQKVHMLDQTVTELRNCYSYDIKLSDNEIDKFIASGESAIQVFCQRFISSFTNFESPLMKKRDFDLRAFRDDVQSFIDSGRVA